MSDATSTEVVLGACREYSKSLVVVIGLMYVGRSKKKSHHSEVSWMLHTTSR